MVELSSDALTVVRRATYGLEPSETLHVADDLDLRPSARVPVVVGVPLTRLRRDRDVQAFALGAPLAAITALLGAVASSALERVVAILGDHVESPTFDELTSAIDQLLDEGARRDEAVAVLALAIAESFPAASHCARLLTERTDFDLPELPVLARGDLSTTLLQERPVDEAVRARRRARRAEESRRKQRSAGANRPTKRRGS